MTDATSICVENIPALQVNRQPGMLTTATLLVKSMRPKQWVKNLIVYVPLAFTARIHEPWLVFLTTLCLVSFCLISSGIYLFNDLLDVESDRLHPKKKNRPIASGAVNGKLALAWGLACVLSGICLSFSLRPAVALVTLSYLTVNLFYIILFKHIEILDAFCIATGFVLRATAGAVCIYVNPSGWFLMCTSLGALFLALEKRRQELNVLKEKSSVHRLSLSGYSIELLDRLEALVVPCLLTSYAFYSFLSPHGEWMLISVPFVLYGVMRYMSLSAHKSITGSPEEVFWRDRPIQATIIAWSIACLSVVYRVPQNFVNSIQEFEHHITAATVRNSH